MANVWKWQAKDASGNIVESAPGKTFFESRGPITKADMKKAAEILLYSKRMDATRAGLEDPGYVVDEQSITAVGDTSHDALNLGDWAPAGGEEVSLPTDPAVRVAKEKRLADFE